MAAYYTFADHSGLKETSETFDNPYDRLLSQCTDDPATLQKAYEAHRTNRNAQQKQKLLSEDFKGVTVDEILAKLENPAANAGYVDPRNCLVFWARPTSEVKSLINSIQTRLREAVPGLWTMPQDCLHMTALEVTHSLTAPEIEQLVTTLAPKTAEIADLTLLHRARLVKPLVSFDAQAMALSFLPAAGEPGRPIEDDAYSYHHLRRDLYNEINAAGVDVASRYVVPSAHLTIGRYIRTSDFEGQDGALDKTKVQTLVDTIEEINSWLQDNYWPHGSDDSKDEGSWLVGKERGITVRKGTLWYGAGETVYQGQGY